MDQVEPGLEAHEKVPNRVQTNASPEVAHEVINALVIRAPAEVAAAALSGIETGAHGADTSHHLGAQKLVKTRRIDAVEVPKQGTILQARGGTAIKGLAGPPGNFTLNPKTLMNQGITADGKKIPATQGLLELLKNYRRIAGRRGNRPGADGEINLLAVCGRRNQKEHTNA